MSGARKTLRALALACGLSAALAPPAIADDKDKVIGSWKLVSFIVQASDTKETKDALGPDPQGRLILAANGTVTNFRVAAGRKPAQNEADRARMFGTMAAWTGRYRFDGDRIILNIEQSWNEIVNGETARFYKLEGKRMTWTNVISSSVFFPGRPAVGTEVFERED